MKMNEDSSIKRLALTSQAIRQQKNVAKHKVLKDKLSLDQDHNTFEVIENSGSQMQSTNDLSSYLLRTVHSPVASVQFNQSKIMKQIQKIETLEKRKEQLTKQLQILNSISVPVSPHKSQSDLHQFLNQKFESNSKKIQEDNILNFNNALKKGKLKKINPNLPPLIQNVPIDLCSDYLIEQLKIPNFVQIMSLDGILKAKTAVQEKKKYEYRHYKLHFGFQKNKVRGKNKKNSQINQLTSSKNFTTQLLSPQSQKLELGQVNRTTTNMSGKKQSQSKKNVTKSNKQNQQIQLIQNENSLNRQNKKFTSNQTLKSQNIKPNQLQVQERSLIRVDSLEQNSSSQQQDFEIGSFEIQSESQSNIFEQEKSKNSQASKLQSNKLQQPNASQENQLPKG